MGFLDRFRRKEEPKMMADFVEEVLVGKGISATREEIEEVLGRVKDVLKVDACQPAHLKVAKDAELECTGEGVYTVHISIALARGGDSIPKDILDSVAALAMYYIASREIAKAKGSSELRMEPGDRLPLKLGTGPGG